MKDELKIYSDKLKEFGLSQIDISSLKNRAYLEGLRDLVFISDFEGIGNGDDTIKDLFYPYEARTIIKIVERKFANIYGKGGHITKKKFILEGTKGIVDIITKLLRVEELTGSQINQLLFYARKVLVEKFGLQNDY